MSQQNLKSKFSIDFNDISYKKEYLPL